MGLAKNIAMDLKYDEKISNSNVIEVLGSPKIERGRYENNNVARSTYIW